MAAVRPFFRKELLFIIGVCSTLLQGQAFVHDRQWRRVLRSDASAQSISVTPFRRTPSPIPSNTQSGLPLTPCGFKEERSVQSLDPEVTTGRTCLFSYYRDDEPFEPRRRLRRPRNHSPRPQPSPILTPLTNLLRLVVVIAFYMLHLLVLSQRQLVFPVQLVPNERGHFTGIGWDSMAGMLSLGLYKVAQTKKRRASLPTRKGDSLETSPIYPWNLPRDSVRFRLTTISTFVLLVQAYFLTGRMSIFWEDLLYELSARDFRITLPLFRALTVLMGHLSWVAVGALLLRWLPRPPPFFQRRATAEITSNGGRMDDAENLDDDEEEQDEEGLGDRRRRRPVDTPPFPHETLVVKKLFRTDVSTLYTRAGMPPSKSPQMIKPWDGKDGIPRRKSPKPSSNEEADAEEPAGKSDLNPYYWFTSDSNHWMWWTIGGYFVSSWFFNLADFANQYLLPSSILQDAQESIVSQLVNPEHNDLLASAVGYIAPCITAPWWEEVLYRGFCLPAMTQLMGYHWAVFWQGVVFSVHHMSLTGALPLAVLGWTWAAVYTKSRNIFTVMIIHMLWNSRVFLGNWLGL